MFSNLYGGFSSWSIQRGVISTVTDASKWTTPDHILCVSRLFKDRPCHLPKVVNSNVLLHLVIDWNDRKYLQLADGGTL